MSDVERYLKRATRGVWGRKRREVREELHVHLLERVAAYRIAGLSEADAVEKALREMGEPGEVSAGMARIYTGPWVMSLGMLCATVSAVAVIVFPGGMAQTLQATQTFPSPACLANPSAEAPPWGDCEGASTVWTTLEAIREVLEPQNIEVDKEKENLSLRFQDGTEVTTDVSSHVYKDDDDQALPSVYQPKPNYFSLWELLEELAENAFSPVRIEGWNNPTIHVGDASFILGNGETLVEGKSIYLNLLVDAAKDLYPRVDKISIRTGLNEPIKLQLSESKPDEVYGALLPTGEEETDNFIADVTRVSDDGSLSLLVREDLPLQFLERFVLDPSSYSLQENTAVLVRLIGESKAGSPSFDYEVIPPEQISFVN